MTDRSHCPTLTPPDSDGGDECADDVDPLANILSLKLKKPKHWKWELSTSRSNSNIALPRVLLYNHKGDLLVDADTQQEQVFTDATAEQLVGTPSRKHKKLRSPHRAATSNIETAAPEARLDCDLKDLHINEVTSAKPRTWPNTPTATFNKQQPSQLCFDRRAISCKEVRFDSRFSKHHDARDARPVADIPTPPSTTTTTTSSSGTREKRYHRRSRSSLGRSAATSDSILERMSLSRGRLSSPEDFEQQQHRPRCFLRSSKVGTLVVQDHSFSRCRRRSKQRKSPNEYLRGDGSHSRSQSLKSSGLNGNCGWKLQSSPTHKGASSSSLQNMAETQEPTRRKVYPVRRYRSDALLEQPRRSSTSSEAGTELMRILRNVDCEDENQDDGKQQRKLCSIRKKSKKGLMTIDPGAGILGMASERATAR